MFRVRAIQSELGLGKGLRSQGYSYKIIVFIIRVKKKIMFGVRAIKSLVAFRQGSKTPICPSFWRHGPRF